MIDEQIVTYRIDWLIYAGVTFASAMGLQRLAVRHGLAGRRPLRYLAWVAALVAVSGVMAEVFGSQARQRIEETTMVFASTYAYELARLGHAQIGPDTAPDDPRYRAIHTAAQAWLQRNPTIVGIYTGRPLPDGRLAYLIHADREGSAAAPSPKSPPPAGHAQPAIDDPELRAARAEAVFASTTVADQWGTRVVRALHPIQNERGEPEAVVAGEVAADHRLGAILAVRLRSLPFAVRKHPQHRGLRLRRRPAGDLLEPGLCRVVRL
ncbi:MAG: hypothetical protein NTV51_17215 [Verrucomicrobia bacterium]|nr:hypothetical protein [Verrucomicrobiota bacterium]